MNRVNLRISKGVYLAVTGLLILCCMSLAACAQSTGGGSGGARTAEFTLDVDQSGERLYQELSFRDQLEELDAVVVYTLLGIDAADVSEQKNYFSSGATAEEILIFRAVSQEALGRIKAILEARVEDQAELYASYAPEEVGYLKKAVLETKGDYLIFCVPENAEAAAKLIREMFAK